MKYILTILLILTTSSFAAKQETGKAVTIFQNSPGNVYNIPNMILTKKGTLIAIIEKRKEAQMTGKHLVCKRSRDGGLTWSEEKILAQRGLDNLVNSAHMVDMKSGRIFVLVNYFKNGFFVTAAKAGYDGSTINRQYIFQSDDDGLTWSQGREITRGVKPEKANYSIINAGGKGIELKRGPHKGRFLIPVWVNNYTSKDSYAIFSDDRGQTWQRSAIATKADSAKGDSSESQLTELSNGDILMITRTLSGKPFRRQAISQDGGQSWSQMTYTTIQDPRCQASLVNKIIDGKNILFLIHPNAQRGRKDGSVSISFDEGKTWKVQKLIAPGSFGYSSSHILADDTLVVFYEAEGRRAFKIARIALRAILEK